MTDHPKDILGKLDQLIDLAAAEPKIGKTAKLSMIKLLLSLKLDILRLLSQRKTLKASEREVIRAGGKREKTGEKERLILKFIGEKGGRAGMDDLAALGMSGRSLRRYLMDLRKRGLIEVEKKGREHFYKLI